MKPSMQAAGVSDAVLSETVDSLPMNVVDRGVRGVEERAATHAGKQLGVEQAAVFSTI